MKKISQIQWCRYKNSIQGKDTIALFEKAQKAEFKYEELLALSKRFDPQYFYNSGNKEDINYLSSLESCDYLISKRLPQTQDNRDLYQKLMAVMTTHDSSQCLEDIPQGAFKEILGSNMMLSVMLYKYYPEEFLPNFFVMQFMYLERIAYKYDIELPEVPKRSDYRARNFYYLDMCVALKSFASENNINKMSELCAFLYDYELPLVKEQLEFEGKDDFPDYPGQAWIIEGKRSEGEKEMNYGFWQANQLTEKGDILLFYETSPVKALNAIWVAQEDGVVDPFYHYYSNTYIGNKISIPSDQSITFEEFKNSEYFKARDKKWNYVSKNFQDVSGWLVTSEDYKEIKRMLESKGFDTSRLPKLFEPTKVGDYVIKKEKDVSEQLLIPRLNDMGWYLGKDFEGEVEFNAGRGKTGYSSEKRPDFCLHIKKTKDDIEAKVVIEVKKHMKNNKEIHANFVQGRSYAKWGAASVLVLCDMKQIRVYQRNKNNQFDENEYIKYSWFDLEDTDKNSELKRLLS